MKQILVILGLIFSTAIIESTYNVGTIDSIAGTNNGGTGYGNATQADATGYVTAGFSTNCFIYGSAMQPDGKAVVVGADTNSGDALIARYTINGTEDATFNPGSGFYIRTKFGQTSAQARAVTVLPNGKIVVVGSVVVTARTVFFVAQFLPDGSLDTAGFAGGQGYTAQNLTEDSADIANAVTVDAAGNIYVVGTSTQNGLGSVFVAKYNSAGSLQTATYNSSAAVGGGGAGSTISGIALLSISATSLAGNGAALDNAGLHDATLQHMVIAGSSSASTSMLVARFLSDGILDTAGFNSPAGYNTLDLSGNDVAYAVGFQSTGKIIIAGSAGLFGPNVPNVCVARYLTSGLLDSSTNNSNSPFGVRNFFSSSANGYINDRDVGGIPSAAYGLAIQDDDKIVVGGTATLSVSSNQSLMIARFLADGSNLDSSFSSNGYTTTYVASLDNGNSLSMQQNGSCILAGDYTNSNSNITFLTARYLGDIPQGCMDYTYNPAVATSPGAPGYAVNPTYSSSAVTTTPKITSMYPANNGNVFVAGTSYNDEPTTNLVQLNSDGQTITNSVCVGAYPTYDFIMNSTGQIVFVGLFNGSSQRGTIKSLDVATGTVESPGSFSGGSNNVESLSYSFCRVAQQKSGRYVVIGQAANSSQGLLIAYNSDLVLANSSQSMCPIFGTGGVGYVLGDNPTTFYDMIIDQDDHIYIAYSDGTHLKIAKYLADGSGLDTTFGGGIVDTGLFVAQYANGGYLSFDASLTPYILFGASRDGWLSLEIITQEGNISSSGSIGTGAFDIAVLTKLQCDTNNRMIFTGYDNNNFFVGRCAAGVVDLDTTFAPYSSYQGILKTNYSDTNPTYFVGTNPPYRFSNTLCISTLGNILFGGYENVTYTDATTVASTVSIVGQVVGNTGGTVYTQVPRFPGATLSGIIDTSFGTDGALDLMTAPASLPNGQAKVMNILATNKILIADAHGTDTVLARLTSAYGADTTFGDSNGLITLTNLVTPTAIMVDATAAYYYILGQNSTPRVVVYKVNEAGATGQNVWLTTALTAGYGIVQQASGRILIAGKDISNQGVIVAYTPAGVLDTSFNPSGVTPGYWYLPGTSPDTPLTNPITALSVGSGIYADKIYFAYNNIYGDAAVGLLLENGTALDSNFTFGTVLASVSDSAQIRMQLDSIGNIVLVAHISGAGIKAARYAPSGANNGDQIIAIPINEGQVLENIICLSNGSTLILAAESTSSASTSFMQIACLKGGSLSFVLDNTFNSSGVLTTNVPSSSFTPVMKDFYALDVISSGGILIAGDNSQTTGLADPYLAKVTYTAIVTKVAQSATALGSPGQLDTTFNADGTHAGFMNLSTELASTNLSQGSDFPAPSIAKVLLQTATGEYFIAADYINSDGQEPQTIVTKMSDDDIQQSFGNSGSMVVGGTNVTAMLLGQSNISAYDHEVFFVVGGDGASGSTAGWVHRINQDDGYNNPQFAMTDALDGNFAIAQQSTGRLIVAGIQDTYGTLIAYDPITGAVDTTFGNNGRYTTDYTSQINSVLVDADDNIYIMMNNSSDDMVVMKLTSNGVADGESGPIVLSYTFPGNLIVASSNHLAFDQDNNIIAVGLRQDGSIQILLLNYSSGSLITNGSFNTWGSITSVTVDTQTDTPGRIYLTGYNIADQQAPYIACLGVFAGPSINFDETFGSGTGYISIPISGASATNSTWYDSIINANGKITVAGYGATSLIDTPYLMRVYGNEFVGQYDPKVVAGQQGTLNQNFGTQGVIELSVFDGTRTLSGVSAITILPLSTGYTFIGFADGDIIKLTNGALLNDSYGIDGFVQDQTNGGDIQSMIMDGNDQLVVAGTRDGDSNLGWIARYVAGDSGILDHSFNETGVIQLPNYLISRVVQQSMGRYLVTAQNSLTGVGQILAYTTSGNSDTTFGVNGIFDATIHSPLYTLLTDQYDRIIYAYKDGSSLTLARLISSGQDDNSFGVDGQITTAMSSIATDSDSQVHIALNAANNIILAARTTSGISVMAYANTTGTSIVESVLNITSLTDPTLTSLVGTNDGKVLLSGYQSGSNSMWIARVQDNESGLYELDHSFGTNGIMMLSFDTDETVTARQLHEIALYKNGQIGMVGYESDYALEPAVGPFFAMAYNSPFIEETLSCLDEKIDGTPDQTFGVTTNVGNGILFYGSTVPNNQWSQVAQAVAMQDDDSIVVACYGNVYNDSSSQIFINLFTIDGLLHTTFNSQAQAPFNPGQALILSMFDNQYVHDMVAYTTAGGINKIILAGFAQNLALNSSGSLVIQYDLTNEQLDSTFGGFNGNSLGVAFGDGKKTNVLGLQSTGRIIASGLDQSNYGLVLGYNPAGNLDQGFGQGGTFRQGTTGIYAQTIDTSDRIIIAYLDETTTPSSVAVARILADGSTLDPSFGIDGIITTDLDYRIINPRGNSSMRVALKADGTIVVVGVINDGANIVMNTWDENGSEIIASITVGADSSYNLLLASFTIASLLIDATGKVIVIGYDYYNSNGYTVALRSQSNSLQADSTFNPDSTPGYIKYRVGNELNVGPSNGLIHPDGRIILVGSKVLSYD